MTAAIWTLSILGLVMSVIGIIDIIKEINLFCLPGVMPGRDFESKRPVRVESGWTFGFRRSENRLALKSKASGLQAEPTFKTISKLEGKTS